MRRSKKKFDFGKGIYYFNIKNGTSDITVKRITKEEALLAFDRYERMNKELEWLGKWDGKKFVESEHEKLVA